MDLQSCNSANYIYLLKEREFIKTNEPVFKIGMTKQDGYGRFHNYPKGSILIFHMLCNDCKKLETELLVIFKSTYKHRKDIGNEYFEGNYKTMIDKIYSAIKKEVIPIVHDSPSIPVPAIQTIAIINYDTWIANSLDFTQNENDYITLASDFKNLIKNDTYLKQFESENIVKNIIDTIL